MAMMIKAPTTLTHPLHNNTTNSPSLSFVSSIASLPNNTSVSRPNCLVSSTSYSSRLGHKSVFIPNQSHFLNDLSIVLVANLDENTGKISSSKRPFLRSKKSSRKPSKKIVPGERIDYKNLGLLSRFTSAQGKILSRQVIGSTLKQQRLITASIKQARILSLMPFLSNEK